jgi:8-oxo-dGTP pyrophosphatase MutT (NUDIX family)
MLQRLVLTLKRRAFWLCSRLLIATYARAPLFGRLRGALGIIRENGRFLVLERADGLGLSFIGGLARPGEPEEATLQREVREETGLSVVSSSFMVRYDHDWPYPHRTAAYAIETTGQISGSWEGTPVWVTLAELERRIVRNQREIVARLASNEAGATGDTESGRRA